MTHPSNPTYQYRAGLQNVGSYQVSGKPFVTGAVNCGNVGGPVKIQFPNVTKWVMIQNEGASELRVGFSSASLEAELHNNTGYFLCPASGTTTGPGQVGPLDLKLTEVWISGSNHAIVVAGLTFINQGAINNPSISPDPVSASYTNWTGSVGV